MNYAPRAIRRSGTVRDRLKTIQDKMQEYIENDTRLGWLINSQSRQVENYRIEKEVEILEDPKI